MLKKNGPIYLAIIIGIIFGNILFSSYHEESVMESLGNVYMLQYGAYVSKDAMNESIKKLNKDIYYIDNDNNNYYVYLGATSNYDNAIRLKKIFDDQNIFIYLKNNYLDNDLVNKIKDYDDLIMDSDDSQSLNYLKEIIKIIKNR